MPYHDTFQWPDDLRLRSGLGGSELRWENNRRSVARRRGARGRRAERLLREYRWPFRWRFGHGQHSVESHLPSVGAAKRLGLYAQQHLLRVRRFLVGYRMRHRRALRWQDVELVDTWGHSVRAGPRCEPTPMPGERYTCFGRSVLPAGWNRLLLQLHSVRLPSPTRRRRTVVGMLP
jgi:hypothetical protein